MKKKLLLLTHVFLSLSFIQAQIGVNTEMPKATMHVVPTTIGSGTAEGFIAPNLTRSQLIGKDVQYTAAQKGAMVYVTDLSGTLTAKTTKVDAIGYYYFDGSIWQKFAAGTIPTEPWLVQGGTTEATTNAQNIYQTGSVAIGSNTAGTYKFQVTGTSNITGNSRVGGSIVVGNETVGGTMAVVGTSKLSSSVGIGRAPVSSYLLAVMGNTHLRGDQHVIGKVGIGTASPVQDLHVVGNEYVTGVAKIGGDTTISPGAQLHLADTDKGFLPNRVALLSASQKAPVTNAVDGMLVYNTTTVGVEGLYPGYYYWYNDSWKRLVDKLPVNSSRILNLASNVTSTYCVSNNSDNRARTISFDKEIVAQEDGSYAFQLRMYGTVNIINNLYRGRTIFFFFVYRIRNGVATIVDAAEVNFYLPISTAGDDVSQTYTLMLNAPDCQAGDKLEIRFGDYYGGNTANRKASYTLVSSPYQGQAARTSMIFWKL